MNNDDIRILKAQDVLALLDRRELDLVQIVRQAYETYADGDGSLPHSTFLLFPNQPKNRIIALPAYLGQNFELAGVKWIASFPDNHALGLDRASAVILVNSTRTGRPEAILEGSIISAKRTAASAALAAQTLHGDSRPANAGLIGCGLINFEITRCLLAVFPHLRRLVLFDTNMEQAQRFQRKCQDLRPELDVVVAKTIEAVLQSATLISFATTAARPYVQDLSACGPGTTILHVSLRDLSPQVILSGDNVVDDVDHVCRAQTSLHLAEQQVGHRDFIRCTLAEVTRGRAAPRQAPDNVLVFSPFGLGVLDLAVSQWVIQLAAAQERGEIIRSFLPAAWLDR
jgi:ornithine cyclodeaminase